MSGTSATADMAGRALPFVLNLIAGSTDNHRLTRPMGYSLPTSPAMVVLATHIVARDPAILSYILSVPVFILIAGEAFLVIMATGRNHVFRPQ